MTIMKNGSMFLFLFPYFLNAQNIDTAFINFNCKMYLFYENYNFSAPTREELKCYIDDMSAAVKVIYLKQNGFSDDYLFVKTFYDYKFDTAKNVNSCLYRIHHSNFYNSGPYYIIGFNIKRKKIYRLNGFVANDSRRFYNDCIYFSNVEYWKMAKSRKSFIKNFYIEGLDLRMLWDRDIRKKG